MMMRVRLGGGVTACRAGAFAIVGGDDGTICSSGRLHQRSGLTECGVGVTAD
jgi:hypothetical protein